MYLFLFWDHGSSLSSLFCIHFRVDCLSITLYQVIFVGFYHIPLSEIYFSVISFFLTLYDSGLLFIGWNVLVPLAPGVSSLVGKIVPGACAGFLVGGTGALSLVGGDRPFTSDGQGLIKGCTRGSYLLSITLGRKQMSKGMRTWQERDRCQISRKSKVQEQQIRQIPGKKDRMRRVWSKYW